MHKKFIRLFLLIASIVFMWSCAFGALRFQWEPAFYIYSILNFPFGFIYVLIEKYFWTHYPQSYFMNGEIVQGVFWLVSVLIQALFYTLIIWKIRLGFKKRTLIIH